MATILILDDDAAETAVISQVATEGDYAVLAAQNLEECRRQMMSQPIDLLMVSLSTISEQDTPRLESILRQFPDTKVVAVASAHRGDGLTTLLRAESLQAQHLLGKPINPQQLHAILNLTFPQPAQQDQAP